MGKLADTGAMEWTNLKNMLGYRVSIWEDEIILEIGGGNDRIAMSTEPYT